MTELRMNMRVSGRKLITGIRTDCFTGKDKEVQVKYYIKLGAFFRLWFYIERGGITGHESFEFNPNTNRSVREKGWSACAGMGGKYDRLFIPASEMNEAITDIEEQLQEGVRL